MVSRIRTTGVRCPSDHFRKFLVTILSTAMSVPLALFSAFSLSDILPFSVRQIVKPVIEIIAAIPSVAYGFFALVIFAPFLQRSGGHLLGVGVWMVGDSYLRRILIHFDGTVHSEPVFRRRSRNGPELSSTVLIAVPALLLIYKLSSVLSLVKVQSGANALMYPSFLPLWPFPPSSASQRTPCSPQAVKSVKAAMPWGPPGRKPY